MQLLLLLFLKNMRLIRLEIFGPLVWLGGFMKLLLKSWLIVSAW